MGNENPGAGGAGGGAGGAGAGGAGGGAGGGEQPKYMTFDEARTLIGESVNGAISGHLKRGTFREVFSGVVKDEVGPMLAEFRKGLEPAKPVGGQGGGQGGGTGGDDKHKDLPPEVKAALAEGQERVARLEAALKAKDEEAAKRDGAARQAKERDALVGGLKASGVPEAQAVALAAHLHVDQQRVKTQKDGTITFAVQREYGAEDWPLAKGLAEYLKTDEGKAFLPPADGSGSGSGRARQGGNFLPQNGKQPTKNQRLQQLASDLLGGKQ